MPLILTADHDEFFLGVNGSECFWNSGPENLYDEFWRGAYYSECTELWAPSIPGEPYFRYERYDANAEYYDDLVRAEIKRRALEESK